MCFDAIEIFCVCPVVRLMTIDGDSVLSGEIFTVLQSKVSTGPRSRICKDPEVT